VKSFSQIRLMSFNNLEFICYLHLNKVTYQINKYLLSSKLLKLKNQFVELRRISNPRFKIHLQQRRNRRTHNSLYEYKKNQQQVIIYQMILLYVCYYIFICCCKFNLQILFFLIIFFQIIIQIYSYFIRSNWCQQKLVQTKNFNFQNF
ncbi:transmembrane protein, putative, partial (macronuclear) [Tetrahymena thermophila SB210]